MKLSKFGQKFSMHSGIQSLMDDLGSALSTQPDMIMMGGGNPAHLPEVEAIFKKRLNDITHDEAQFRRLIGIYDAPQGENGFIEALVSLFREHLGWPVTAENIAITNGSQSAFFMLFNMLAGERVDHSHAHILFPMVPEYIGYTDAGLSADFFRGVKPLIEKTGEHRFKYRVDFDNLKIDESVAALCISRPTNPTGNVVTDEEVIKLDKLAKQHDIPLIIDGAYGLPFPNLVFNDATPFWSDNTIVCLSLSKFGLPAARTGIVIANTKIIQNIAKMNAILNLASGSFGGMLSQPLIQSGEILNVCQDTIKPYYLKKRDRAIALLESLLNDNICYAIHEPEGAMFIWLWIENLPLSSAELYESLKAQKVLVVSGHYFFPGLDTTGWAHSQECIRITYTQSDEKIAQGLAIIAQTINALFT